MYTEKKYQEFILLKKLSIVISLGALFLTGCAAPAKFDWTKEGVSKHDKETSLAECSYQIKLSKSSAADQAELLKLCMQGKGYRVRQVN
jgi:hypothetical protein